MKKLLFILLLFITSIAWAETEKTANELFFDANKYYSDAMYEEAARVYEMLLSEGIKTGSLYYNLGNTYFRLGRMGKAMVNYERAKRLMPDDEDIISNYFFVKSALGVKDIEQKYRWYEKIYLAIINIFSIKTWFFMASVSFVVLCIVLGIGILKYPYRKITAAVSAVIGVIVLLSLILFYRSYSEQIGTATGIIISPKAEVRYSPSYSGVVAFKLQEGMKAQIIRKENDWSYIRLNRESSGWIQSELIEQI